jgi:vancomycin resistance protein YoaR
MAKEHLRWPRWLMITVCAAVALLLIMTADYAYHRNRIYSGVFINELDVGKKSRAEAKALLQYTLEQENIGEKRVRFVLNDLTWNATFEQIGITPNLAETVEEAFQTGREKAHILRYPRRIALAREAVDIAPKWDIQMTTFFAAVKEISGDVRIEPENASFTLLDDDTSVEIIPDLPGRELDQSATYKTLQTTLADYPDLGDVNVSLKEVEAKWTAVYLESLNVKEEIATFSTAFSAGNQNRAHNIRLAAHAIDELLILPDELFSFNETVGRASADQGYKSAPVIVSGEIVEGIGGGVCQVSSTLYNAVLLADVPIVERQNHSLRVAYLPPGLDATVAYDSIDFKFQNDRNHAIWIRTFVEGGRMTVRLYGSAIPGHEVKVETLNVTTIPAREKVTQTSELPKGVREKIKDGQPGYQVTVWRVTTVDGEEIKREKISYDTYRAVPAEYRVGTAEIPALSEQNDKEKEQDNREEEANQ